MSFTDDNDDNNDDDRPKTPGEEDCCGSGCTPCIFDIHKKLLNEWEQKKSQNIKNKTNNNLLSLLSYKTFIITSISEISEYYILVNLEYKGCKTQNDIYLIPGQYVIVHSWNMSRPYTPIMWTRRSLVLLIKIYKESKFSIRLKNTVPGTAVDIRGPYGDFKYINNSFQQIVMFSIGSGIAAVYPIARTITNDEMELTKIHLVAGFQSIAHIPLKKELRALTDYWNFKCTLYLSQLSDKTVDLHGFNVKAGRLNKSFVTSHLQDNDIKTTLILICGTPEFNQFMRELIQEMNYIYVHIFE